VVFNQSHSIFLYGNLYVFTRVFIYFWAMLKPVVFFLCSLAICFRAYGQGDIKATDTSAIQNSDSHLRISLLTCSPGLEVYETFGHSVIRIIDSTKTGRERDIVYNYGFLESSEDNTVLHQLLSGRLHVFLATNTFDEFKYQYTTEQRGVTELLFLLDSSDKALISGYLQNNLRRENRYYYYDAMHDNCSTRIVAMLMKVFGYRFVPAKVLPTDLKLSFRNLTTRCGPQRVQHKYWYELGMELFFSSKTDALPTNIQALYLADYCEDGIGGATLDGKKLCAPRTTLFEEKVPWPDNKNEPLMLFVFIAVVTIAGLLVARLQLIGKIMSFLVLVATGVLGCCMLYLWMIDAEPSWKDNFNVIWALPTNIILPFLSPGIKKKYAVGAIALIGLTMILHILRIQQVPLLRITPLFLTLIFVYGVMYRKAAEIGKAANRNYK